MNKKKRRARVTIDIARNSEAPPGQGSFGGGIGRIERGNFGGGKQNPKGKIQRLTARPVKGKAWEVPQDGQEAVKSPVL